MKSRVLTGENPKDRYIIATGFPVVCAVLMLFLVGIHQNRIFLSEIIDKYICPFLVLQVYLSKKESIFLV
jgi:hypothetical protein